MLVYKMKSLITQIQDLIKKIQQIIMKNTIRNSIFSIKEHALGLWQSFINIYFSPTRNNGLNRKKEVL